MTIGFLGSTKHRVIAPNGSMVDADKAFSDGFGRRPDFENLADGKYRHLGGDATNLFNQRVELICATGGIPSAQAAAAAANNIPVLIIVGEVTGALSGQNIAGINLLTSKNIFASADFLRQQTGFRTDQIVLLVNTSSPAGHDEKVAWEAAGGKCLTYTPAGDNNENDIPTDIRPKLVAAQQRRQGGRGERGPIFQ
jgi:hypothetical protein